MSKQRFHKSTEDLRIEAAKLGYQISITNKGHIRFDHPHLKQPIFHSGTPSKTSAARNCLAKLKRSLALGFVIARATSYDIQRSA